MKIYLSLIIRICFQYLELRSLSQVFLEQRLLIFINRPYQKSHTNTSYFIYEKSPCVTMAFFKRIHSFHFIFNVLFPVQSIKLINQTGISEFPLLGLTMIPSLQPFIFNLFFKFLPSHYSGESINYTGCLLSLPCSHNSAPLSLQSLLH